MGEITIFINSDLFSKDKKIIIMASNL